MHSGFIRDHLRFIRGSFRERGHEAVGRVSWPVQFPSDALGNDRRRLLLLHLHLLHLLLLHLHLLHLLHLLRCQLLLHLLLLLRQPLRRGASKVLLRRSHRLSTHPMCLHPLRLHPLRLHPLRRHPLRLHPLRLRKGWRHTR